MTQTINDKEHDLVKVILANIRSLKFGQVLITVHDSKVVQIEKVERTHWTSKVRWKRKEAAFE